MAYGPVWADGSVGAQGAEGAKKQVEGAEQESAGQQKATEKKLILERGHHHIIRREADPEQSRPEPKPGNPLNDHRRMN